MSTDRVGDIRSPQLATGDEAPLPVASLLAICDRLLDEIGRRRHLFSWLRAPDAEHDRWLAVDAYYPGNRVVVVCRDHPSDNDGLYADLVPAHGLRLLELRRSELGPDPHAAKLKLQRMIGTLELPERPVAKAPVQSDPGAAGSAVVRALASLLEPPAREPAPQLPRGSSYAAATERAARFVASRRPGLRREPVSSVTHRPSSRPRPALRPQQPVALSAGSGSDAPALLLGIMLAAVIALEIYAGIGILALKHGHVVLGLGMALDACARVLGAVAAQRSADSDGSADWTWLCALGGSPLVAGFAYLRRTGPAMTDPGPLAGLVSVVALAVILVALLTGG